MNEFEDVMNSLKLRFTSGNSCEVQTSRITREEFDIIKNEISKLNLIIDSKKLELENYRQEFLDSFRGIDW